MIIKPDMSGFTITKADFRIDYYRSSKHGGQKGDKTSSACRITHPPSGAVKQCEKNRSKEQNTKAAFLAIARSKELTQWIKLQAAMLAEGFRSVEHKVDLLMKEGNLEIKVGIPKQKGDISCGI